MSHKSGLIVRTLGKGNVGGAKKLELILFFVVLDNLRNLRPGLRYFKTNSLICVRYL